MKSRFDAFNSGVLKVCNAVESTSTFAAVKNITAEDDLTVIYSLAYSEMSKREQDEEFAYSAGHKLDLKVKVRYLKDIDASMRVLIGRRLYSIYQIDGDANKTSLFLYLEKEREIG